MCSRLFAWEHRAIAYLLIFVAASALFFATYRLGEWICGRMAVQSGRRQEMRRELSLGDSGDDESDGPGRGARA
jgi:hypothetical protein